MKLELKHLAAYLPYGLTGLSIEENLGIEIIKGFSTYGKYNITSLITDVDDIDITLFKPILRPLSDLKKEIEVNSEKFVPNLKMQWMFCSDFNYNQYILNGNLEFRKMQDLLEWHFDIYGLIDAGLAIDINTL